MANIHDVARQSGYSIKTISRAINDHAHVSEKAKRKIFEVMKELDYYPNSTAQQLRGKGTKLIGVIISYITNPFFSYLVDAIEKYASNKGYQIIVLQTQDDTSHQQKFIEMLKKRQLDGLIIASIESLDEDVERFVEEGKIVICNRYLEHATVPSIRIDEKVATQGAINYLISKGHQRIAYCSGGLENPKNQRFIGYLEALEEYGVTFDERLHFEGYFGIENGRKFVTDFLKMPENERPSAVFANGDELAAGIVSQCGLMKVKVPEELAVIGFDDQPIARVVSPQLTTVRQPIKEMGEYAAAFLIAKLNKERLPESIKLETKLIIRGTA